MSKEINTGGPAFPVTPTDKSGQIAPTEVGLSMRDYFAANAPAEVFDIEGWTTSECLKVLGLPSSSIYSYRSHYKPLLAKLAYEWADAMLKARGA